MTHYIRRFTDTAHAERLLGAPEHLVHIQLYGARRASRTRWIERNDLAAQGPQALDERRESRTAHDASGVRVGHKQHRFARAESINCETLVHDRRAHDPVRTAVRSRTFGLQSRRPELKGSQPHPGADRQEWLVAGCPSLGPESAFPLREPVSDVHAT